MPDPLNIFNMDRVESSEAVTGPIIAIWQDFEWSASLRARPSLAAHIEAGSGYEGKPEVAR